MNQDVLSGKWIQLEIITLGGLSQSQKDKYRTLSLICGSYIFYRYTKSCTWISRVVKPGSMLATKPDDLGSICRGPYIEGEKQRLKLEAYTHPLNKCKKVAVFSFNHVWKGLEIWPSS